MKLRKADTLVETGSTKKMMAQRRRNNRNIGGQRSFDGNQKKKMLQSGGFNLSRKGFLLPPIEEHKVDYSPMSHPVKKRFDEFPTEQKTLEN